MVGGSPAKVIVRQRLRAARRTLPEAQRMAESAAAVAICRGLVDGLESPGLASYAALPDEVDLEPLHRTWWERGRVVLLPRVIGPGLLSWHRVGAAADLISGAYGIREPDPDRTEEVALPPGCLILVPGIGFTSSGWRLGQGGGFYDRVLKAGMVAVGIGFTCQLVEELPVESHDRRLDGVVIAGQLVLAPQVS